MPELADSMYCSEQICIPPTFPYLLRQFAKAAIRTQPTDLLKWSTAYFRCLSLNLPPPSKPRLEYPIPRDFLGITPGWLKSLIYQLSGCQTVPFKVLWDRWIGSCLEHSVLIEVLCLGGFDEPQAVPWFRFIALCAAHLTDDLTHTMIMVCEILTEEPEGGSAMITLETFVDIYTFLARIDASVPVILKNKYFPDSLLDLWREKQEKLKAEIVDTGESISEAPSTSLEVKSSEGTIQEEAVEEDLNEVISCPSIPDQTLAAYYYLGDDKEDGENLEDERSEQDEMLEPMPDEAPRPSVATEHSTEEGLVDFEAEAEAAAVADDHGELEGEGQDEETQPGSVKFSSASPDAQQETPPSETPKASVKIEPPDEEDQATPEEGAAPEDGGEHSAKVVIKEEPQEVEEGAAASAEKEAQTAETPDEELRSKTSDEDIPEEKDEPVEDTFQDEQTLKEDLERLRHIQEEMAGETDEELEKFKSQLLEEMPLTKSMEDAIEHYKEKPKEKVFEKPSEEELVKEMEEEMKTEEEKEEEYEDVPVPAIPGIGGRVPEDLIGAVIEYVKKMAKIQHGMVMPRNIRHYSCPPLEVLKY